MYEVGVGAVLGGLWRQMRLHGNLAYLGVFISTGHRFLTLRRAI